MIIVKVVKREQNVTVFLSFAIVARTARHRTGQK